MVSFIDGIIVWIHLLCSSIWVGGSIFIGLVLGPMLNTITKDLHERITLMIKIGQRFNKIAFPSFLILVVTGIYNSREIFEEPKIFFETGYGIVLFAKIILVCITFLAYLVHIRILNTETTGQIKSDSIEHISKIRNKIINLGKLTVITSVLILLMAAILDSGIV